MKFLMLVNTVAFIVVFFFSRNKRKVINDNRKVNTTGFVVFMITFLAANLFALMNYSDGLQTLHKVTTIIFSLLIIAWAYETFLKK